MSKGLIALIDDIAGIAKVAAASLDNVVTQVTKAGSKAAGIVIDDAAVTPRHVVGFAAEREIPMIRKIATGSIFNKMVILLPAALLLRAFAPWLITSLLVAGGAFPLRRACDAPSRAKSWPEMSEILASLLRGHHFHTPHRQDRLPSLLRLAKRLGAEVETMQCYRLCLGPGEPRTANWCPTCARGEIFGAGHRQALQSLELVLGYNAEVQPVGYIDPWQERLR